MLFSLLFLNLVGLAVACADDELHARDGRAYAHAHDTRAYTQVPFMSPQVTITAPDRQLVWGDFNVIQTTDTHGWLLGHQRLTSPEPNYSGTLGEFASFVKHMKDTAIEKDVDLLLVDSGDVHDGTGLSEGFPSGGVDGHDLTKFLRRLPYDLMTIGNHEINDYSKTFDMYTNFIPHLNGYYLSSNANLTVFNPSGQGVSVPVGKRYAKFWTRKGRLVTSLGVHFNLGHSAPNTNIQTVAKMVGEPWFAEAIAEKPDVFVLLGHMPISDEYNNWLDVVQPIHNKHPDTPILIFGGHSHIRDCQEDSDGRTIALQSGRYMETIGWLSANISAANQFPSEKIPYTRRYLDQNRVTYEFHTNKSGSDFDTEEGLNITQGLRGLETRFNLTDVYGTVPKDYTMCQNNYTDEQNVFKLFIDEAASYVLNTRNGTPIIINNGVLRYDIFQGDFTKNDTLTASPYPDKIVYISDVPVCLAKQALDKLNSESDPYACGGISTTTDPSNYTLGYNTTDRCGNTNDGDDTKHSGLPTFPLPAYLGSSFLNLTNTTEMNLVIIEYIWNKTLTALNGLNTTECPRRKNYTQNDVHDFTDTTTDQVLPLYAKDNWPIKP